MSLKYGLNLKKAGRPPPARHAAFDDLDDEDDAEALPVNGKTAPPPPPPSLKRIAKADPSAPPPHLKPPRNHDTDRDLSAETISRTRIQEAETLDPSIFDYDSFHDAKSIVTEAKKQAARQDAIERKPKYINNLLDAAARRKQDQLVAREKLLQREREAEGDEFADKETFVTGAYKQQQEESRRLQEEEQKRAEDEERRKRQLGGGMQSFYRDMMDQNEKQHQEAVAAASQLTRDGGLPTTNRDSRPSDVQLAEQLRARGVDVQINEEGQVTDKRQLLSAGLNVGGPGQSGSARNADHLKTSNQRANGGVGVGRSNRDSAQVNASRERQTRMMEEQLAAQAKRAREEADEERERLEKAAKSTKTTQDVNDAKARYLARKAAKERGEG